MPPWIWSQLIMDTLQLGWGTEMKLALVLPGSKDTNDSFLGGAWMGPLANLLMRTLLNVTIKVNNIVVKCVAPTTLATLTCKSVCVRTAENLQLDDGQVSSTMFFRLMDVP